MKRISVLLAVTFILASCGGNVAKYQPMIEDLSTKWAETTNAVTQFSNQVTNEQTALLNLNNSMQISPDLKSNWDETTTTAFNNIQSLTQSNSNGLTTISSELDAFISTWMEKGKELKDLKDGVAAGKLTGDVQGTITSLTSTSTDAMSKLAGWQEQFGKVKSGITDATSMFSAFQSANNL